MFGNRYGHTIQSTIDCLIEFKLYTEIKWSRIVVCNHLTLNILLCLCLHLMGVASCSYKSCAQARQILDSSLLYMYTRKKKQKKRVVRKVWNWDVEVYSYHPRTIVFPVGKNKCISILTFLSIFCQNGPAREVWTHFLPLCYISIESLK